MILVVLAGIAIAWLSAVVVIVAMCVASAQADRVGRETAAEPRLLRLVA